MTKQQYYLVFYHKEYSAYKHVRTRQVDDDLADAVDDQMRETIGPATSDIVRLLQPRIVR